MISSCIRTRGQSPLVCILSLNSIARSIPRWSRTYASPAAAATNDLSHSNPLGVQLLPPTVHSQLFSHQKISSPLLPTQELIAISRSHLARQNLLTRPPSSSPPITFDLPSLAGKTLDEHFYKLGMEASSPYLRYAREFAALELPPAPAEDKWVWQAGWTKYYPDGSTEAVAAPEEECLVFDVEVLFKISPFAVMACAASPRAWYAWLSPWVLGETKNDRQLIPLGNPETPRIVVGHHVGFDRIRVKEEYNIVQTASTYLDTMSLHVASNGMATKQKSKLKHKGGTLTTSEDEGIAAGTEDWVGQSSLNSLKDVALFHCGIEMDKTNRDNFGILNPAGVCEQLNGLLSYCAQDVAVTHKVYQKVLPRFLEACPHPVSFAALRHISSATLPVNRRWETYIANAETTYRRLSDGVRERLINLAEEALELKGNPEIYTNDPWLQQLNWSGQEIKLVKGNSKTEGLPRPTARRKQPGMPKWYKDLFQNSSSPISLTVRTRIAPILLRMMWDGYPLVWSDIYGWTFRIPKKSREKDKDMDAAITEYSKVATICNMDLETNPKLKDDTEGVFFKLPHKEGPAARCFSPLSKGFQPYFDSGILSSEYALAKEALEMNSKCAYWMMYRERIMEQVAVWQSDTDFGLTPTAENPEIGIILPRVIPMGTVTRRVVEPTWLTAPSATPGSVGSEIKAMVTSPPGYVFVGADVDSEELWIASLVGDAVFGFHGGSALGYMNLEGTKAKKTDVHSRTASMLGITRNDAKVINYSRIYGAGVNFATMMLLQLNPGLGHTNASIIAEKMYRETKGQRTKQKGVHDRIFWCGGAESFTFNKLESFIVQEALRTPVLGAGITMALTSTYLFSKEFTPSRINWVTQSSGVDYLHLLLVAMEYLTRRYDISARVAITIHDEVRYLCKEEDKYRCAMALQVANLWTRAMFSQQMGINDLPQSVAYFSAVDIDHVLRKEVDMPCVTPSHSDSIPHGESLDITALLEKGAEARLDPEVVPRGGRINLERWEYTPRESVMDRYRGEDTVAYLKAQIACEEKEIDGPKLSKKAMKKARAEAERKMTGPEKKKMVLEKKAARARKKQVKEIEQKVEDAERTLANLKARIMGDEGVDKQELVDEEKALMVGISTKDKVDMMKKLKKLEKKLAKVGEAAMAKHEMRAVLQLRRFQERLKEVRNERKRVMRESREKKRMERTEKKKERTEKKKAIKEANIKRIKEEREKMNELGNQKPLISRGSRLGSVYKRLGGL